MGPIKHLPLLEARGPKADENVFEALRCLRGAGYFALGFGTGDGQFDAENLCYEYQYLLIYCFQIGGKFFRRSFKVILFNL